MRAVRAVKLCQTVTPDCCNSPNTVVFSLYSLTIIDVRAEAWVEVEVASPATVEVEVVEGDTVEWGQEVEVLCSASSGHPPPRLQLSLLNSSGPAVESQAGPGTARLSHFPALEESGARFGCRWWQEDPQGHILYQGQELSGPLEVVMAPSLTLELETSLLYYPGLTLAPQLMSRPVPAQSEVVWRLLTQNQTVFTPSEAAEAGLVDLVVSEVISLPRAPFEWTTSVQLFNLTENLTLWLQVETAVGPRLEQMFLVTLPDPSEMAGSDLASMTQYQITFDG